MKMHEFMLLVQEMRSTQKEYFQTRDRGILSRSKELERRVDRAINENIDGQQSLFDRQELDVNDSTS